jgi:hypothetical protein
LEAAREKSWMAAFAGVTRRDPLAERQRFFFEKKAAKNFCETRGVETGVATTPRT